MNNCLKQNYDIKYFPFEFIYFSPLFPLLNRNILDKKYEETKKT